MLQFIYIINNGNICVQQDEAKNKCEIKPKGLNIIWGNDPRYWKITDQYAELTQVSWLEVSGKVTVKKGRYTVKFDVEVKPEGFGWGTNTDVLVMAKVGKKGLYIYKVVHLVCGTDKVTIPTDQLEIDVPENDLELHFGLYEVWSGKWKGGLKIYKAEVAKTS